MPSSPSRSAGSDGQEAVEEKKRRRMESNRESARRSRQKKQRQMDDLISQVAQLQIRKEEISGRMSEISRRFGGVEAANAVLGAEKERLAMRLESLESVVKIARELETSSGSCQFGMGNPWRRMMKVVPGSGASVSAMAASSAGMFQF